MTQEKTELTDTGKRSLVKHLRELADAIEGGTADVTNLRAELLDDPLDFADNIRLTVDYRTEKRSARKPSDAVGQGNAHNTPPANDS